MVERFIDGKTSSEILSHYPDVAWSEGRGRVGNIEAALNIHRNLSRDFWQSLDGKRVLLRPNVVDPYTARSCSGPEALTTVVETLLKSNVGQIIIGDQPAIGQYEQMQAEGYSMQEAYRNLYPQLYERANSESRISFVDFDDLPERPIPGLPISLRDAQADAIVNLVLPKEHGQYYFTCASKMLMGLVPVLQRPEYFHKDGHAPSEEVQRKINEAIIDGRLFDEDLTEDMTAIRPESRRIQQLLVEVANGNDPHHMTAMAKFILGAMYEYQRKGIPVLTVVDGYEVLREHEHVGRLEPLNVAGIGLNPVVVDRVVMAKLGFGVDMIEYIRQLRNGSRLQISGDSVTPRRPRAPFRREIEIMEKSAAGFKFRFRITPDK